MNPTTTYSLEGTIVVPPSKSITQRALALAMISDKTTILHNVGRSEDEKSALKIIKNYCTIRPIGESKIEITPKKFSRTIHTIFCGESGLCMRLFTPIFMASKLPTTITGKGTIIHRPLTSFESIFDQLHISFQWYDGKLPLSFQGKEEAIYELTIDGSLSSQFVSGMILYGIEKSKINSLKIKVQNPTSIPYIHLTIELAKFFGISIEFKNNEVYIPKDLNFKPVEYTIESDWSSASFWIVGAALMGNIVLEGLNLKSTQADIQILDLIQKFGAKVTIQDQSIQITQNQSIPFQFDATNCPDLIPILVILAIFADGECQINGIHRLVFKESNRADALQKELKKLNILLKLENDTFVINGSKHLTFHQKKGEKIKLNSHNDHRLFMAFHILALKLQLEIEISHINCCKKSYPNFLIDLQKLKQNK